MIIYPILERENYVDLSLNHGLIWKKRKIDSEGGEMKKGSNKDMPACVISGNEIFHLTKGLNHGRAQQTTV
jgi:hypothetical protein